MKRIILSSAVCLLLSTSIMADENKWYMGANIGQNKADSGIDAGTASLDEKDTAWKVYGGYNFSQYFALEMFYADLGEMSLKGNNGDTFSLGGTSYSFIANNASVVTDAQSFGLNVVGSYPLHKYFEPFAKIGLHRYDIESTVSGSNLSTTSVSDDGTDIIYGLGFKIPVGKKVSFVAEWERFEFNEDRESDFLSMGLIYKF